MDTVLSRRILLAGVVTSLTIGSDARAQANMSSNEMGASMRLRFAFSDQDFTARLEDNPSARDLFSMVPLDLTIEDYSTNEKIAYLPRKLTEEGSGAFSNERPGDLCYYAPWGNLAFFHAGYRWSRGLIRLGRLEGSFAPLLVRGTFPLNVKRLS